MTVDQLQEYFATQLNAGGKLVFYMTVQTDSAGQLTGSVLRHNTETASWEDLLASLAGYSYQDNYGPADWPRFSKD